jgi:integrase
MNLNIRALMPHECAGSVPLLRAKEETLWLAKLAKSLHEVTADGSSGSIWAAITKPRRRHSAATIALAAGVSPKVVSEQLGHASTAFTLDTYAHVLPHMQDEAAARVEAMLLRQTA